MLTELAAPAGQFNPTGDVDLADYEWIISGPHTSYGRAVQTACRRAGLDLNITHQGDEQATALVMVSAGFVHQSRPSPTDPQCR